MKKLRKAVGDRIYDGLKGGSYLDDTRYERTKGL